MLDNTMSSLSDLFSDRIRVGIIRGGQTPEYELSLKTGAEILRRLQHKYAYDSYDVMIDRNGSWYVNGKEIDQNRLSEYIDLAWIATHGDAGSVARQLEHLDIPYLGSDSITSELTYHRGRVKQRMKDLGLQTPDHVELNQMYTGDMDDETREGFAQDRAMEVFGNLPGPWVVKPLAFSARFHTYLAKTFPELVTALKIISMDVDDVLIEEYIDGREFVSGVVPDFRGQEKYVIPPHEIQHDKELFTHQTGRVGDFTMVPASRMSNRIKDILQELSETLHQDFNLDDTGVFHFIVSPKGVYVISLQDGPELHEHAPLYKSLDHVGSSSDEFIHSRIARLLKKKK